MTETIKRLPIVGVMGSGPNPHSQRASKIGAWLAGLGVHLLTGGGAGVMESVSKAFYNSVNRMGLVIGIIPGTFTESGYTSAEGYPNRWVEIPIFTHLPLSGAQGKDLMSRNHVNILSSDVIIALPGSAGTISEIKLARQYNKPLIAYLHTSDEMKNLPSGIPVEPDFNGIKKFVLSHLKDKFFF